jgi:uncharacterized Zn-finger protein
MSEAPAAEDTRPLRDRLHSGRVVCPKCNRKGVGYAAHAHAYGWKDYGKASCRYCHTTFKIKARSEDQ